MSIIIKSGSSGDLAEVTSTGELKTLTRFADDPAGLSVRGAQFEPTGMAFGPGETGVIGPVNVVNAGNATFVIKNADPATPFTGTPVIMFEQSDDGQNWAPLPAMRSDTNVVRADRLISPLAPGTEHMFDAEIEGASYVRALLTVGPDTGGVVIAIYPGAWPFSPSVIVVEPARTNVVMSAVAVPAGTSGTEKMLDLNRVVAGSTTVTSANSFTVANGHRFRIQSIVLGQITGSVAAVSTFRLRYNANGPVNLSSLAMLQTRLATPATAGSSERTILPIPDGFEFDGDGVASFGFSCMAAFATGTAPTLDVMVLGYEY